MAGKAWNGCECLLAACSDERRRTADILTAMSRISNPQDFPLTRRLGTNPDPADWKSATQQVGNLRHAMYRRLPVCRIADFQSARFGGFPKVAGLYRTLPTGSRRYPPAWRRAGSRLETCGTPCTAGFQSAVSRISNPQDLPLIRRLGITPDLADWKSATQQVGNLRHAMYRRLPVCRIADFQSAGLPFNPTAWDHPKTCRLEVGDTAGWKPAARGRAAFF